MKILTAMTMEENKTRPSLYCFSKDMHITRIDCHIDTQSSFTPGDTILIDALYGYRFLTKSLIKKNLTVYGHTRLVAEKLIKSMRKRGLINRYRISSEGYPDIDFYTLSELAMNKEYGLDSFTAESIPYILEMMAISQFHMGSIDSAKCSQYLLNHEDHIGQASIFIPSVIRIKTKPNFFVASISSPRNHAPDSLNNFMKKVILLDDYMKSKSNIFRSYSLIIVCESESKMKDISTIILNDEKTRDILILYSLDEESNKDRNPLSRLHRIKWIEGNSHTELINLID